MTTPTAIVTAAEIMARFAERTGLVGDGPVRRYLWTDAFAVCNFLELHRLTGDEGHRRRAEALIEQVHETLGRHRADDPRRGWISGLGEEEGRTHPTRGGLRIGKELPERGPSEPFDEHLEWECDGQYFHYLTRWMHALCRAAQATEHRRYLGWAIELAVAAHRGFTLRTGDGPLRMVWKMSIDLRRPLVPSMGHHDPLDGLVTGLELRAVADGAFEGMEARGLDGVIADLRSMCSGRDWTTSDPLGLGGLLADAHRLAGLADGVDEAGDTLVSHLLGDAAAGLDAFLSTRPFHAPAWRRLAFRELGLAIGLHAVERLEMALESGARKRGTQMSGARVSAARMSAALAVLRRQVPLARELEQFWLDPEHQAVASWTEHIDINAVMLATSLVPGGYLAF